MALVELDDADLDYLAAATPGSSHSGSDHGPRRDEECVAPDDALASAHHDPYALRRGYKTRHELDAIKRARRSKSINSFYEKQNDLIVSLLKPMEEHTEDAKQLTGSLQTQVRIAIWASLLANIFLCFLQMYAAIVSESLSLLSTGIDAVFDMCSNMLLVWLHHKALNMDKDKWPVGGARLETIGNILYGFLMGTVNIVVFIESARSMFARESEKDTNALHLASLIEVSAAWGVKFILFLYCFSLRKRSSQVQVLWEDHRNDLWINGFGVLMSAGGSKIVWYLDPLGAMIIALGVIISWGITIHSQFELLAGKSAPHDFIQLIIYKAVTFSDEIDKIDTVRAYHSGPDYFVELDIVMNAETPLWKAHDIGERLQDKIEALPGVERTFVHVDHETNHAPEHRRAH
ncbi:CDF manganese transporter [Epithele typhae]|uniref:CDF manganese transporter n=1 Tax=Epithele typhae TaxID=378194 RepID=UPI002007FB68|nr:CDF manganese transporter [Epithele typhae]KAH9932070.1 CDF manganese transporter [Epithele typhae]